MRSSQSREFHIFFAQLIVAGMVFAEFNFFAKKCEISQKCLRNTNENFSRKFLFPGNPTCCSGLSIVHNL